MRENYYVGLDIGTDSVGWAVTDRQYNLLRAKGKDMWGAYLFDPAKTAAERRGYRTARRRTARVRQRIKLLQELFAPEVYAVDPAFFIRMEQSKFVETDKTIDGKDAIFHDEAFGDKEFYKKFPTIYHLRAAFLDPQQARGITDVRLLYLAIHHIIKNRGHFLFEGQNITAGDTDLLKTSLSAINAYFSDDELSEDNKHTLPLAKYAEIADVLKNRKTGKNAREAQLKKICDVDKADKTALAVIRCIVGKKVDLKDLFGENHSVAKEKLCFDDVNFDKNYETLQLQLNDEEAAFVDAMKAVYDWAMLAEVLNGNTYLSLAMIERYRIHAEHLKMLKSYIKSECPERYAQTFRRNSNNNYAAYVGSDRGRDFKHCTREDFYKYLRSFVKDEQILQLIERGEFLPKLRTSVNGVIPYQVHRAELVTILKNAEDNFPFLKEEQDGFTVAQKIIKLLEFRIPYYVGPLSSAHESKNPKKGFYWAVKNPGFERTKITPWNFDKIIDRDASEDKFISRMTNKCTYLLGEDVLPKSSLLYSEFTFRNELNNLCFKDNRLSEKEREEIFKYATEHKRVTLSGIGKLLEEKNLIECGEGKPENFSGTDGDFHSSLSSLIIMKRVLGENFDRDMAEQIILWATLTPDKDRLVRRVKNHYSLPDDVLKKIKGLSFSGWGRLSEKFLTDIWAADDDGVRTNIIEAMKSTGANLMELLSAKYGFSDAIKEFNADLNPSPNVEYSDVDELYCSPSVKRAIWRTICLVREIEKINGCPPKRIFVEMARGATKEQKGKRTTSRKEQIKALFKDIHDNERDWVAEIESQPDNLFSSDKMFMYYMQMGKCAYSGENIPLTDVFNTNLYDIDHIYPQSKIKDDSLDNRVLCKKKYNQDIKKDVYPVSKEIRDKMRDIWAVWLDKKLISKEKYKRLTRSTPLTEAELSDFIDRQLVETRQSTKAVATLLKRMYPDSEIVYSKAGNVADFKEKVNNDYKKHDKPELSIVKIRELNDLHHAKDAYLNIIVGNVYFTKFNRNAAIFFKKNNIDSYNLKNLFDYDLPGAWKVSEKERILQTARKNTCRVVRFVSEEHGKLFDATIKPKGANDKLIPLKANGSLADTDKYGGYDSASTAYFALVSSIGKKNEKTITLEAIPIYIDLLGENAVNDYIKRITGDKNATVLIEKIKLNSLLKICGSYCYLRGKTGSQIVLCNANQFIISDENAAYLKKISRFCEKNKKAEGRLTADEQHDGLTKEKNLEFYRMLVSRLCSAPYSALLGQQAPGLREKESVFAALAIEEQCSVIMEVMHFFQCNSVTSNLQAIGGVPQAGKIYNNKKLSEYEEILLISQSPTGFYQKTVSLTGFYKA